MKHHDESMTPPVESKVLQTSNATNNSSKLTTASNTTYCDGRLLLCQNLGHESYDPRLRYVQLLTVVLKYVRIDS